MITNIKSALISGVLMTVLAIATYILSVGDIFSVDGKTMVNIGIMSLLTAIVSFVKSSFTSDAGKFAGIKVK